MPRRVAPAPSCGGARRPWFEGHGASEPGRVHGHPSRRRAFAGESAGRLCGRRETHCHPAHSARRAAITQMSTSRGECRVAIWPSRQRATPLTSSRGPQIPSTPGLPGDGARRLWCLENLRGPIAAGSDDRHLGPRHPSAQADLEHVGVLPPALPQTGRRNRCDGEDLRQVGEQAPASVAFLRDGRTRGSPHLLEGAGVLGLLRGIRALPWMRSETAVAPIMSGVMRVKASIAGEKNTARMTPREWARAS